MMQPSEPIADHRRACADFTAVVAQGDGGWTRPSPCAEWDARGVVEHVIGIHDEFLLRPTATEPVRPDDDPIARWSAAVTAIEAAIAVVRANQGADAPALAGVDLDRLLPALTGEVLTHTWDLAKAIGVDPHLDLELCALSFGMAQANAEQVQSSGLFGAAVPVPPDADAATQLVAFFGRDPGWTN